MTLFENVVRSVSGPTLIFLVEVLAYMKNSSMLVRQSALPALSVAYAAAQLAHGTSGDSYVADSRFHSANQGRHLTQTIKGYYQTLRWRGRNANRGPDKSLSFQRVSSCLVVDVFQPDQSMIGNAHARVQSNTQHYSTNHDGDRIESNRRGQPGGRSPGPSSDKNVVEALDLLRRGLDLRKKEDPPRSRDRP